MVSTVSGGIEFRSDVVDPTDKKRTKAVGQLLSTVVRLIYCYGIQRIT